MSKRNKKCPMCNRRKKLCKCGYYSFSQSLSDLANKDLGSEIVDSWGDIHGKTN